MTVEAFLDANILVYAASTDPVDAAKADRAQTLIASGNFGLSGQVFAEAFNVLTRKFAVPLSTGHAIAWLSQLESAECVPVDFFLVRQGAALASRYQISSWDGAIIAAAIELGATTLYSEDLNHGQVYDSVTVCNPFQEI